MLFLWSRFLVVVGTVAGGLACFVPAAAVVMFLSFATADGTVTHDTVVVIFYVRHHAFATQTSDTQKYYQG